MKRTSVLLMVLCFFAVVFAQQAIAQKVPDLAGNWSSVTKYPDKNVNEQWTIKQQGDKVTGTVKGDHGEMPFAGSIDNVGFFRVDVKDGDMVYKVRATLDDKTKDLDGSILIGAHEHVWAAKMAKK